MKSRGEATSRVGNDLLSSEQRIKLNLSWCKTCAMSLVPGAPVHPTIRGFALARQRGAVWLWEAPARPCPALPLPRVVYGQEGPVGVQRLMSPQAGLLTVRAQLRGTAVWAEVTSFLPQKGLWKGWKNTFWPTDYCGISPEKGISFFPFCSVEQKQV